MKNKLVKSIVICSCIVLFLSFIGGIFGVLDNNQEKDYRSQIISTQKDCDNVKTQLAKVLKVKESDSLFKSNYKYYLNDSINAFQLNTLLKNKDLSEKQFSKMKDLKCEFHSNQEILKGLQHNRNSYLVNPGVLNRTPIKIKTIKKINSCR